MATNYDAQRVAGYFDAFGSAEWDRLTRSPVDEVNLHIHAHYLRQYIRSGDDLLEIGAGAGRFTQILAELNARITVADISPVQLELNRANATQYGFEHAVDEWQQVDICQMARFDDASFDVVVAYGGPFSYVLDQRGAALRECVRVLKPNGLLISSVMSMWGSAHRHLDGVLAIPPAQNRRITTSGDILPGSHEGATHFMHMFRAGEFRTFLEDGGLEVFAMSASNCLSLTWNDLLAEIRQDREKWAELLRMEREATAEPGALDMGTHLIAVARKPR